MGLLIATPCYGGQATVQYIESCHFLAKELRNTNIPFDFLRIRNESLITRGRNVCATSFLRDTDFDNLLFVDSDIEFDPADVARLWNMLHVGADVAVGNYSNKSPDANNKGKAWIDHKLEDTTSRTEPFEVTYAATGFMMIPRATFERLKQANPKWRYQEGFPDEADHKDENIGECWAFFQDPIMNTPRGRFHMSEDYFFCSEVQKLGMKVMMDPLIHLKHWGQYAY